MFMPWYNANPHERYKTKKTTQTHLRSPREPQKSMQNEQNKIPLSVSSLFASDLSRKRCIQGRCFMDNRESGMEFQIPWYKRKTKRTTSLLQGSRARYDKSLHVFSLSTHPTSLGCNPLNSPSLLLALCRFSHIFHTPFPIPSPCPHPQTPISISVTNKHQAFPHNAFPFCCSPLALFVEFAFPALA